MEKEICDNRRYCAYGFRHGVSERFQRKPLFGLSRTITTQGNGGVILQTEEIRLTQAGSLNHYGNDQMNRVYSKEGLSPTIIAKSGGGREVKIEAYSETTGEEPRTKTDIRKFTEEECFRLMGVKKEDYELLTKNQTSTSLYHLPGDSIVTTCLMAIFGQMLDVDYEKKIKKLVEELKVK